MEDFKNSSNPLAPVSAKPIPITDEIEFVKNRCEGTAKKITTKIEKTTIEVWFHKHYYNRSDFGDKNGKREGIDPHFVEALILKATNALIVYSTIVDGFSFVNHPDLFKGMSKAIVIQDLSDNPPLSIVIEAHLIDNFKYEVTVKTAMKVAGFRLHDGQYVIEIHADGSILSKNQRGVVKKILEL